jgi:hypothetical protein
MRTIIWIVLAVILITGSLATFQHQWFMAGADLLFTAVLGIHLQMLKHMQMNRDLLKEIHAFLASQDRSISQ